MLTLKKEMVYNQKFEQALVRLSNSHDLALKIAYDMGKIVTKCTQELKKIEKLREGLFDKYADKDDKGVVKIETVQTPQGPARQFKLSKENQKKFDEEFNPVLNQEFVIPVKHIRVSMLEKTKPSPSELSALNPILSNDLELKAVPDSTEEEEHEGKNLSADQGA